VLIYNCDHDEFIHAVYLVCLQILIALMFNKGHFGG
jgi:hypothetical protein